MIYTFKMMPRMWSFFFEYSLQVFNIPQLPELMKEEFDLLIVEAMLGDIHLGFSAHFNCPAIAVFSMESTKLLNDNMGNPTYDSFVPSQILGFKGQMTFPQRVANYLSSRLVMFLANIMFGEKVRDIYE